MDESLYSKEETIAERGSVTLSCRLDRTLYKLLQNDSRAKGISLNSMIGSIVKRYISWEKYAAEIGFIPLARETVRLIFDDLDERKMLRIANHLGRTVPREMILLMFNKVDFNSIISFLEITLSRYGMVQHIIDGLTHTLVVHHRVSKKFSNFLAHAARAMAEDLKLELEIKNADSKILSIRIEELSG